MKIIIKTVPGHGVIVGGLRIALLKQHPEMNLEEFEASWWHNMYNWRIPN